VLFPNKTLAGEKCFPELQQLLLSDFVTTAKKMELQRESKLIAIFVRWFRTKQLLQ